MLTKTSKQKGKGKKFNRINLDSQLKGIIKFRQFRDNIKNKKLQKFSAKKKLKISVPISIVKTKKKEKFKVAIKNFIKQPILIKNKQKVRKKKNNKKIKPNRYKPSKTLKRGEKIGRR